VFVLSLPRHLSSNRVGHLQPRLWRALSVVAVSAAYTRTLLIIPVRESLPFNENTDFYLTQYWSGGTVLPKSQPLPLKTNFPGQLVVLAFRQSFYEQGIVAGTYFGPLFIYELAIACRIGWQQEYAVVPGSIDQLHVHCITSNLRWANDSQSGQ
jgi:hypothetical protein